MRGNPVRRETEVPASWWPSALLGAIMLAALALITHEGVFLAGNDASRFALIESLVERGVGNIDGSRYAWTVDKVFIDGHAYSNKPPLLSIAGAGLYWLVQQLTGWTFAHDSLALTRLLTWLLVGVPTAGLVFAFDRWLRASALSPTVRGLTLAALATGTILTSYSGTLNNHSNAAAALFLAFLCAWRGRFGWSGWWAGVTTWIDILPGLAFIPVLLWQAWSTGGAKASLRMLAVLAACAGIMLWGNWFTLGSVLLPKLVPGAVDTSSNFASSVGGVLLPDSWLYPLECLFAGHGLFSVSPVLLFGAWGLGLAIRAAAGAERVSLALLAGALAIFVLAHVTLVGSYGGWAYGFRYLIPVMPLLCAFIPHALQGRHRIAIFAPVLAASVMMSALGAYHPWVPAYEQEANKDPIASLVTNPVGGNAAALADRYWHGSAFAAWLGAAFIDPDPGLRRQYLAYFRRSRSIR